MYVHVHIYSRPLAHPVCDGVENCLLLTHVIFCYTAPVYSVSDKLNTHTPYTVHVGLYPDVRGPQLSGLFFER